MEFKNYYKILGVDTKANNEEIKKAYRKLVLVTHPDINKSPDAHRMFIEIHEAYRILFDEVTRAQFDNEYLQFISNDSSDSYVYYNSDLANKSAEARDEAFKYAKMKFSEFVKQLNYIAKETTYNTLITLLYILSLFLFISGCNKTIRAFSWMEIDEIVIGLLLICIGIVIMVLIKFKFWK